MIRHGSSGSMAPSKTGMYKPFRRQPCEAMICWPLRFALTSRCTSNGMQSASVPGNQTPARRWPAPCFDVMLPMSLVAPPRSFPRPR